MSLQPCELAGHRLRLDAGGESAGSPDDNFSPKQMNYLPISWSAEFVVERT
jgi:hypothetical protein